MIEASASQVDRAGLLETFAAFPERLGLATAAALGRPVRVGEWGPAEVARHLLAVEDEVWRLRFARVMTEDDPHWSWTEPGQAAGFDDAPLPAIVAAFAAARAANVATVRALDEAGWARSGTHAIYGRLDVAGLLRVAIEHDADHLAGIAER